MYLTRIPLDLKNRKVMRALSSPSVFHGAVESMFSGERKRRLWRLDSLGGQGQRCGKLFILVLSEDTPNTESFLAQFGGSGEAAETKSYDKLLGSIKTSDKFRFRLTANPTFSNVKLKKAAESRGKVCAEISVDLQKKWLLKKSEANGFALDENGFGVVQNRWYRFYKQSSGGRPVSLLSVTFEGILEVTDAELFRDTLINGIGREKAYGMGLLTVLRVGSGNG